MDKSLRTSLVIMGFVLIITGILLNMQLYTSIAPESLAIYQYSYGFVGVVLDISKVLSLLLGVYLLSISGGLSVIGGTVALLTYVVLSVISLLAGWGFGLVVSTEYEQEAMLSSTRYSAMKSSVDSASAKINQYSQYAAVDSSTLKVERDNLQSQLDSLNKKLSDCPANYFTHCINPTKAEISAVSKQLLPIKKDLMGYQSYQSALTARETALNELSSLDSGDVGISHVHPLFMGIAATFGTTPELAKNRLLLVSFAMLEYLGAFFYAIGLLFNQKRAFSADEIEQAIAYRQVLLERIQAIPVAALPSAEVESPK